VHNLWETHEPYLSGNPSESLSNLEEAVEIMLYPDEKTEGQAKHIWSLREDGLEYTGQQLEFCLSFFDCESDSIIITSDHVARAPRFLDKLGIKATEDMFRVPLIIRSKALSSFVYEDVYSTIDMPNLLRQLINCDTDNNTNLSITSIDYARQELEPRYNRDIMNYSKTQTSYRRHKGCIVLTTNNERYTFFLDGYETYHLVEDLEKNLIEDERYRERIDYFRSQIDIDTRDVWKSMFQMYPHLLEYHKEKVEEYLNEDKNPKKHISS
jgi:hypothetical protein